VTNAGPSPDGGTGHASFAHASEAELARILDFYEVRWTYEPDTFPIAWNLDGDVIESFSPDFYLPDVELYVELTTLKQKLVRKKNRKLRRLRELYPDIRIKLFYARDFRMLLLKFGRLALLEDLTGSTGQATPPRPRAAAGSPVIHAAHAPRTGRGEAAPAPVPAEPAAISVDRTADDATTRAASVAGSPRGRRRGRRRHRSGAGSLSGAEPVEAVATLRFAASGESPDA
jgi:hypothetical protein